jgi:uncharacterized protein
MVAALPVRIQDAIGRFRSLLQDHYGERLLALKLFGSQARGDVHPESDVDLLVLLEAVDWRTKNDIYGLAADVCLATDVALAPTVVDRATWEVWRRQGRPLFNTIEREGIPL